MSLSAGTRLGPYEILTHIGAGGMGEVYKARDTRLDRAVAVKISAERFTERFEREARAVAALNHPNICTLHDVGTNYIVMEYIEGTPLKGPLPLQEAVEYAGQILEALDAAHKKGITHGDLKPANILATKQGIKLLDFGLAKQRGPLQETDATLTAALTEKGQIVGTLQYMSPEQLQGKEADPRSDLFSFGCVLYEVLTGKRAFEGQSAASIIAAILEREPAPLVVAPPLERVVRRSLAKDPDQRFQTARDLKAALTWAMEQPPTSTAVKAKSGARWKIAGGVLAAAALAVSFWALFLHFRVAQPPERVLRYSVAAPDNSTVQSFAVSPDGRYVTIAAAVNGRRQLWLRRLDALQAQPMPGTDDAAYPFWSPDSHYIGFFAQGKLKKVAASGGPAQSLCNATNGRGGSWSRDDVIVFSPDSSGVVIQRVPAAGGVLSDVTKTKISRFPMFLPDGHHFLYTEVGASREKNGVYLSSLDGNENRRVLPDTSSVVFGAGHLLFLRENTLMAQPFDPKRAQISGAVFPVAEGVSLTANTYFAQVTVSENGMLLYASGASVGSSQIVWFHRDGKPLGSLGAPGVVWEPSISPDEKVVAFRSSTDSTGDIWLRDLARRTDTRFTFGGWASLDPSWSPKGDRIVFVSNRAGTYDLYQKAASGSGQDELLHSNANLKVPYQWSPDGRFIVYSENDPKTKFDLWVLPVGGGGPGGAPPSGPGNRKPIPFLQTEFNELYGQLSPDGRWMAYTSDESGQNEVYVRPFPAAEGKWRISTAGGEQPRWRGDGKEVFFVGLDGKMTAVVVTAMAGPRPSFGLATPVPLFETHIGEGSGHVAFQYDVTADGKRFVVATNVATAAPPHLTVVVNWIAGFKR